MNRMHLGAAACGAMLATAFLLTTPAATTAAPRAAAPRSTAPSASADRFELEPGDRLLVIGGTFEERMALSGYFDALAHAAHPDHELVIRHAPGSADEVGQRPREMHVPTVEDWLEELDPTVIVAAFGMSESFAGAAGLESFETELAAFLDALAAREGGTRRIVLVSPIAHEDLGTPMVTGAALAARNADVAAYTDVMRTVAGAKGARFVDLYAASAPIYDASAAAVTSNGIHPNELGCFHFARAMGEQLGWLGDEGDASGDADRLRTIAFDKHYHFRLRYRATNTEYVWGRRAEPFGVVNFPPEMAQLERMIAAREAAMWAMAKPSPDAIFATPPSGAAVWETVPTSHDFPEDDWEPAPVEAKGTETSLGSLDIKKPDEFAKAFTVADGYVIECFASEQDFPELAAPLAMSFDARGRLWVIAAPTYPHLLPGEMPECKLLVLEDTDDDGRADDLEVFADHLYIPTGFGIDTDAVYLGQAPDLWKLSDTDGDGKADRREIVASGFGMPDSHHTISAFEWDPSGGLIMHEGVFTKTSVETPWGTRRTRDAAVWRFDPRTQRLEVLSHCGFANPWGHVFDDFGNSMLADASGGANFAFSHVMTAFDFPRKPNRRGEILNRGRPTAGCELISSRHFPEDVQHTFLVNQSIGFHGTRWDRLVADGSSWKPERLPQDMLECSDVNFRPVAMEVGPDGALYIVDWCNPIVGHMQYSVRDPRRDHTHGRVWRIRHAERDLLEPPAIVGSSIPDLLEHLRIPERNTRQHARQLLLRGAAAEVFPELARWLASVTEDDPLHDRLVLEALWIHQAQGRIDLDLLDRVAALEEPRARAAAYRVLRHWLQARAVSDAEALPRLARAVGDEDMRVRIEGVLACGFVQGQEGAAVAALAAEREMDDGIRVVLEETIAHLAKYGEPDSAVVRRLGYERMTAAELAAEARSADAIDGVVAEVILTRPDCDAELRADALSALAPDGGAARVRALVAALASARRPASAETAIAPMLLDEPAEAISDAEATLRAATDEDATRAAAYAALVRAELESMQEAPAPLVARVLALLPEGSGTVALTGRVSSALETYVAGHGNYDGDLDAAVDAIVRQHPDRARCATWLAQRVNLVADSGHERFGPEHALAMACLRALNALPTAELPDGPHDYTVAAADPDRLARGRALYHDEINGCVRCHGATGQGEEGFPPLAHSPWIVGQPARAAGIVVHGLQGRVTVEGATFESVMEPLGANLDDDAIADVLTFVRQSFGNYAPAVDQSTVAAARAAAPGGGMPWDAETLLRRYPLHADRLLPSAAPTAASLVRPVGGMSVTTLLLALGLPVGGAVVGIVVFLIAATRRSA